VRRRARDGEKEGRRKKKFRNPKIYLRRLSFSPFMTRTRAPFRKARSAEAESLPFFSTVQVEIFLYLRGIIVD
jgi:hypothetical protein